MKPVVIELVSGYCNSQCVWCFNQYETGNQVAKKMMKVEDFTRIIDINPELESFAPFSHGECLLHPNFCELMEYAEFKGKKLHHIHTNLSMELSDRQIDVLKRFSQIVVNIGGTGPNVHRFNMGTNLNLVMLNLIKLEEVRPRITIKMVLNKMNRKQIPEFHGYEVKVFPVYFTTSDSTQEDMEAFFRQNLDEDTPCRDNVRVIDGKFFVSPKRIDCPDRTLTVRHNGAVQVCCRPRALEGIVGNALEDSLSYILGSEEYRMAYSLADSREYVRYCRYCS